MTPDVSVVFPALEITNDQTHSLTKIEKHFLTKYLVTKPYR